MTCAVKSRRDENASFTMETRTLACSSSETVLVAPTHGQCWSWVKLKNVVETYQNPVIKGSMQAALEASNVEFVPTTGNSLENLLSWKSVQQCAYLYLQRHRSRVWVSIRGIWSHEDVYNRLLPVYLREKMLYLSVYQLWSQRCLWLMICKVPKEF